MVGVSKFNDLKDKFTRLYNSDATYSVISETLGIGTQTIREWRKKLDLPIRQSPEPVSWMDSKKFAHGMSPNEVVRKVASAFGIFPVEIPLILSRFDKLREMGLTGGRDRSLLILAATYEYLRWKGSGKQPVSPNEFSKVCQDKRFALTRANLLMLSRLYKQAGLFPSTHLKPQPLFEKKWPLIKDKYSLTEHARFKALELMSAGDLTGRTPEVIVAGCIYTAVTVYGLSQYITQKEIADEFGVTEVSVRNMAKVIQSRSEEPETRS